MAPCTRLVAAIVVSVATSVVQATTPEPAAVIATLETTPADRFDLDAASTGGSVVSSDGRHVYVAGIGVNAFARDLALGTLRFLGTAGTETHSRITASPNGAHLYAYGFASSRVFVYARDAASGASTPAGFFSTGSLTTVAAVGVSPDGLHVYVAGRINGVDGIVVTARDPATGALTPVQTVVDGVGGVDGLRGPFDVAISNDGAHVYVTAANDQAVTVFARDGASGTLTFVQVIRQGGGVVGLDGPRTVVIAPDGGHVYVASQDPSSGFDRVDAVAVFSRAAASSRSSRR